MSVIYTLLIGLIVALPWIFSNVICWKLQKAENEVGIAILLPPCSFTGSFAFYNAWLMCFTTLPEVYQPRLSFILLIVNLILIGEFELPLLVLC